MRDGKLLEADLEEIYFYKIDRPKVTLTSGFIPATAASTP